MATEKITLTLPVELMREMREAAPPRGLSKMVSEAIEAYLEAKRKKKLEEELKAGYLATNAEMAVLTQACPATDFADWERHVPAYNLEGPNNDVADSTRRHLVSRP